MGKKLRDEDLVLNIVINGDGGKKEIGELERAIRDTNRELRALEKKEKEMRQAGQQNSKQYKAVADAIKDKNNALLMAENRLKNLKSQVDLNKMSLTELKNEMNRVSKLRNLATPLTENWRLHDNRLKEVTARYNQLRGQAQTTGLSIQKLAGRFNHYIGVITAGFATMTAAAMGIRRTINDFAEFDDKVADVMKTTDMTKESVLELNGEFKAMDTRTAQNDLLGLARIAGKLGIQGREDILGFVRASDKIGVALSEDLGGDVEKAITAVGKLVDIFKVDERMPLEFAMLKVGSVMNELGMASTANEGYIVEFTRRLAGIGALSKINVTDIMAMASTLDSLGQTSEVSSTALSKLFIAMSKNYEVYAKYAGMSAEGFKALVDTDANEAFIRMLEGVKDNSQSLTELAGTLGDLKQDGGRVVGVLGSLANNTETLRKQQKLATEAYKDGNSVVDEFNIKNETAQAKVEKYTKRLKNLSIELGEKLMPVMTMSISGFSYFIRILNTLIDFFREHKREIIVVTTALVAYNAILWATNLSLKQSIALTKLKIFWEEASLAATQLLAAGQMLLAGNIKGAAQAMRIFNSVAKLNPFVLIASLAIAAGMAIYQYRRQVDHATVAKQMLNDANLEAEKNFVREQTVIENLMGYARDLNVSYEERQRAIKRLNEMSPEYLGGLNMENINTQKAIDLQNEYLQVLLKKAKFQAAEEKLVELEKERLDALENGKNLELSMWQTVKAGFAQRLGFTKKSNEMLRGYYDENNKDFEDSYNTKKEILQKFLAENQSAVLDLDGSRNRKNKIVVPGGDEDKEIKAARDKAEEERLKQLEKEAAYRQKVLEGQLSLIEQEKLAYKRRLEEAGIYGKRWKSMTAEEHKVREALEKQHRENLDKIDGDAIANRIKERQAAFDHELQELRIMHNEEFKEIKTMEQARKFLQDDLSAEALRGLRNMRQAQQEIDKKFRREEEALVQAHLNDLKQELEYVLETGQWDDLELSDKVISEEEKAIIIERLNDVRKKLSELGLGTGTEIAEERGLRTSRVDILGFTQSDWEIFFENLANGQVGIDGLVMATHTLGGIWAQYNDFVSAGELRKLREFESASQAKQTYLKRQLDAGIISQEQHAQQTDRINQEIERKRAVYERNRAKRERNVALMSAIVNTAAAVAKSLPNLILAKIVGLAGGLQIGTILKTPLPEVAGAEDGGFVKVVRSQDRRPFRAKMDFNRRGFISKPSVLVSENGKEFVANNQAVQNPTIKPVLDVIDSAQRNGSISSLNLYKVLEQNRQLQSFIGKQAGGYISQAQSISSPSTSSNVRSDSDLKSTLDLAIKVLKLLSEQLKSPITAEVALTGKKGLIERMKELDDIEKSSNL